jgi:hypothetical protein
VQPLEFFPDLLRVRIHTDAGIIFAFWKRIFEVNVDGPFLTTWAVKGGMLDGQTL